MHKAFENFQKPNGHHVGAKASKGKKQKKTKNKTFATRTNLDVKSSRGKAKISM